MYMHEEENWETWCNEKNKQQERLQDWQICVGYGGLNLFLVGGQSEFDKYPEFYWFFIVPSLNLTIWTLIGLKSIKFSSSKYPKFYNS